jgi:hypothetical protein
MRHINGNQGPSRRHESDSYSLESDMGRPFDAYLLMRPGCRRGEGRLWSANEAVLQLASGGECVVIEKACESYNFCDIDESDWQRTRPSWREAKGAVAHEARLYAGPLAALQGRAVPRFLGLFGRLHHDDEIWHMLLEDAGEPLHLEERANSVVQ